MSLPENVYEAICRMFMCDNLEDHLTCYHSFYEDLKECTFIVFSENEGSKLPESLCTDYDHDFAIINLDSGVKRSSTFDINLYLENLTRY